MTPIQVDDLFDKHEVAHLSPLLLMFVILFTLDNHAVQMLPN